MKSRLFLLFFLLGSFVVSAQKILVKSKIISSSGEVIIGANIVENGTPNATVSDLEGKFSLSVKSENALITVSFVGYTPIELPASSIKDIITLDEVNTLQQIVVVGTRSLNRSSTDTPSAIDIIDLKDIKTKSGQLDINQLLQYAAPSFNSNRQSGSDGTDHVDPASLRGLGPDQTLVLVNGKRRHQSSLVNIYGTRGRGNTGTDLNAIPIAAIERIEILRDGAAAQYGSDAIAGVINIILKKTTEDLEVNASVGVHSAKYRFDDKNWDGLNYNLNGNYGFKVGEDGFVNLTADYNFRDRTNRANINTEELARREFGDPQATNTSLYLNASLPISSKSQFYVFGGSNMRNGSSYAWTRFADDDRNIIEIYPNGFDPLINAKINDNSVALGFRTLVKGWDVDVSNTFGNNSFKYRITNTLNASMGVTSPTEFDAGGFGLNQNTVNLGFTKYNKAILAGLNIAFGAEYRKENYNIFAGEKDSYTSYKEGVPPGSQGFPGFQPRDAIKAGRSNIGVYFDTEADFTKSFMIGAAVRYENYSDFGGTLNGKLSTRLKVNDVFTLRGTANTGFRAPSLPQVYFNSTVTNFINGVATEVLIARNASNVAQSVGIPALKEEVSQNASLGFTLRPNNSLSLTVDGYVVKVKDRIVLTGQFSDEDDIIGATLQGLNVGKAQFFTNAVSTTTKGLDVVLAYKATVGEGSLTTSLAANFNNLSIDEIYTNDKLKGKEETYFDLREQYFLRASAPPSKINLTLDYQLNKLSANLRLTRFGQVELADWNYDAKENDIYSSKITTDLSLRYAFTDKVQFVLGGNNILDVYPDTFSGYYTESGGAWDPVQMGWNGRYLYTRLKLNF